MAGILRDQPGERAAMVWDAEAMAVTRESEMMRDCLAAGAIRDLPDLAAVAGALGLSAADAAGGGTACGLAGASSDGYSSGNGLLTAFGFGWIIGNRLAGASVELLRTG